MWRIPDHPVIAQMERFGYIQEPECPEYEADRGYEEDWEYEQKRERELFEDA